MNEQPDRAVTPAPDAAPRSSAGGEGWTILASTLSLAVLFGLCRLLFNTQGVLWFIHELGTCR